WQPRNERQVLTMLEGPRGAKVVVDLAEVTYGGSELMAFLFRLRRRLRVRAGQLAVAGAKGNVRAVLQVVRIDRLIDLYDSVDDPVAALNDHHPYDASEATPQRPRA